MNTKLSQTQQDRIQKDLDQVYIKLEQLVYRMDEYGLGSFSLENFKILEVLRKFGDKAGLGY